MLECGVSWQGYETLYKGVDDVRLGRVLVVAAAPDDVARFCAGTVRQLADREVHVELVLATGAADGGLPFARVALLGHAELALPAEPELRGELVAAIRGARPDVVVSVDPTPMLHQHPDHRALARAALDASWPYAGSPADPALGTPHGPKEAWLYGGPAPDLFVALAAGGEERFAQVDLRAR